MKKLSYLIMFILPLLLASFFTTQPVSAERTILLDVEAGGSVIGKNADYLTAWNTATVAVEYGDSNLLQCGQLIWLGNFLVKRHFFRFDTSKVEGWIRSASLIFNRISGYADEFGGVDFVMKIQEWTDGDDGLDLDDFLAFGNTFFDDGLCHEELWIPTEIVTLNFSDTSFINKGGYTDLVMRSSLEIAQQQPSDWQYVQYFCPEPDGDPETPDYWWSIQLSITFHSYFFDWRSLPFPLGLIIFIILLWWRR